MNCKMQNKQTNTQTAKEERNSQREREFLVVHHRRLLLVCLGEKRKESRGWINERYYFLSVYLSNARTYTWYDCIDHSSCVCVCVCFDRARGKKRIHHNCCRIWKRFEPFKVAWRLWFAIAICLSSARVFFLLFFHRLFSLCVKFHRYFAVEWLGQCTYSVCDENKDSDDDIGDEFRCLPLDSGKR